MDLDAEILHTLARNPAMTVAALADSLHLPKRRIERHLALLKKQGHLLLQGSPRAGKLMVQKI